MKRIKLIYTAIISILLVILVAHVVLATAKAPADILHTGNGKPTPLKSAIEILKNNNGKIEMQYYREVFNEYYDLYCADSDDKLYKGTYSTDLRIVINGNQTKIYKGYTGNELLYEGTNSYSNTIAAMFYLDTFNIPKEYPRDPNGNVIEVDFNGFTVDEYTEDGIVKRWRSAGQMVFWKYYDIWYEDLISSNGFKNGGKGIILGILDGGTHEHLNHKDETKKYEDELKKYMAEMKNVSFNLTMYYLRHGNEKANQELVVVDPGEPSIPIDIPVKKIWNDSNNQDGLRPNSITVELLANGATTGKTIILNAGNNWNGKFTGLLQKDANGNDITYTVKEKTPLPGYNIVISGDSKNGFTITNTHTPEKIEVSVEKVWNDDNNRDGLKPPSIEVELYKNGSPTNQKATLNGSNNWTHTYTGLDKYENGAKINYSVKEIKVPDYTTQYSKMTQTGENKFKIRITNTHVPEKIEIPVEKIWDDDENRDGIRPNSITVELYANGKATGTKLTLSKSNNWKGTFTNLYKYEKGTEIAYTVKESGISAEHTVTQSGNKTIGFKIKNTHKPVRINIPVEKIWDDMDDLDEIRPESITVELYANGKATGTKLTLSKSNNWKGTFTNLYKYEKGTEIAYTVKESGVSAEYTVTQSGDKTIGFKITNKHEPHYDGYVEISGKVWKDVTRGKENAINGKLDSDERGMGGIKVTLRQANGRVFDSNHESAYTVMTEEDGTYTIKVNYDNSNKVYKLYEDSATVLKRLETSYIEFEYDGLKYTTVTSNTSKEISANTSRAKENETSRNTLDSNHATVIPTTLHPDNWNDKNITAETKGVISFIDYKDKITEKRAEVIKYCDGKGNSQHTNYKKAWNPITTNTCKECEGKEHTRTFEVEVTKIQNVNLGLFEREQPELSIISDISKVEVTMNNQKYTYLYGKRAFVANSDLKINYQNKDNNQYQYKRPLNPADISYVNDGHGDAMKILVTYKINVANLSSTLSVTINSIINAYDKEYTIESVKQNNSNIGYSASNIYKSNDFNEITLNTNIKLEKLTESDDIFITYSISQDAIKGLLQQKATLDNAVEIQSYSTKYGSETLYAEQGKGGRTGNPYAGYDFEAHPGNAGIHVETIENVDRLKATKPERDTDIAPSFVLCKDEPRILSGNVWEDTDEYTADKERLGNGLKENGENNLANAKIELLKVNKEENLEIAYLYNKDNKEDKKLAVTYSDENGNYSFGDEKYGVVTDRYVMKFTYGEGIDEENKNSTINNINVNARNYKSTIISNEAKALYDVFKGTSSDENWHLNIGKGYSIAVDDINERIKIEDLQYSNFDKAINMTAYSKPFKMQVEFDPKGESQVGEDGKTTFGNELNVFDFGIIERAREDIYVDKTVSYLKVTLANGQVLTEGDPRNSKLDYVKAMGLNNEVKNGEAAKEALDKQILIEMDSELLQGAQIEVKYEVKVVNNSEIDYDYYVDDKTIKTEYYYFGTNNEDKSPVITSSVNKLVDYVSADIADGYSWENSDRWEKVPADSLREAGKEFICEDASNTIKSNEYVAYVTTQYSELAPGETSTPEYATAKKLLANQDNNSLDNHIEILQIDAKVARTIKETGTTKEYKPGDYIPSLEARKINRKDFDEAPGKHEQDDDRINVMVTNATGVTNYITTYVITGVIGLMVIALGVVFIKKKVLKK